MGNPLVFIDTEFTNFHDPKLISIGLAASSGEEFYAEVPYALGDCNEFVRHIVLPRLDQKNPLPQVDLRVLVYNWLKIIKVDAVITICHDSEYDKFLFLEIFNHCPPRFVEFRLIGPQHVNEILRYGFHKKNKLVEHHALNDVRAIRHAYREPLSKSAG